MSQSLSYLMLFGGCIYLLVGGDFLVRGSLALARKLSLSPVIVGLTVVALGTSLPELVVSVHSALNNLPGIAIGNVVGSNIANVLLVLGVPALIHPMVCLDESMKKQAWAMLLVSILFVLMCLTGEIGFIEAALLLTILLAGLIWTVRGEAMLPGLDASQVEEQLEQVIGLPSRNLSIASLVILGCIFLPVGANLAVEGAVEVSRSLGVSEAAIASTMVALGTSLPELSSTVIAAYRRSAEMAFGNVIGSNLFNILLIIGVTGTLTDIEVPAEYLRRDLWFLTGAALLLLYVVLSKKVIGRVSGSIYCAIYSGYCILVL
ncbi:MAG: calcium/sodium antiporter [Gammaproteobacteria bacterium]